MITDSTFEPTNSDLVTIRVFMSLSEASIAKGALEAFGIACMTTRDDCAGQRPSMSMVEGIRLIVRADDVAEAEEILTSEDEY
jgi:hypothetical protein